MIVTLDAVVPVALLIVLGWWLRRRDGPGGGALWAPLERITYAVLSPALFVSSIARADLGLVDPLPMLGALAGSTLAATGVLLALRRVLGLDGPAFTSVVQGGIRLNTYVGVIVAAGLYGTDGVALFALASAVLVPLVNVVCVTVLVRHGRGGGGLRTLPRQLAGNPLILGCAAGLALNLSGLPLPAALVGTADLLGDAALACGMLCVGAALSWRRTPGTGRALAVSSAVKLVALPLLAAGLCRLWGLDGAAATAVVLIQGLPTAASAYVLARRMGGDAPLMSTITAGQTVLALLTLPLALQVV
ncbi:AEC family transporter [Streptomyces clavuligerus]|uniref:Auxin Efflux Carrier n=1 Tax=Streptomyces clavuligerus TaxID=1901 RepID=B5H0S8_STRCL|nr:AEC family transporter [Streptomyces clavuligerus]ANW21633.1 transporter [Streptomyces clavuligerus]AXU16259.1 AEC family transporter [Streptomyces clavuligerus]EDY52173.1 auxin Efflux Carrier [Streptomyces clavuligerus]EFG05192.1 Auxin Efflux Carrier [Streptomyces clavuligerus]MBY6306416.1 AEC family transporter [Streptomyces clavuligerus]